MSVSTLRDKRKTTIASVFEGRRISLTVYEFHALRRAPLRRVFHYSSEKKKKTKSIKKLCYGLIFFPLHVLIYINQKVVFQLQVERATEHALSILIRVSLILPIRRNRRLNPEHPVPHPHAVSEECRGQEDG